MASVSIIIPVYNTAEYLRKCLDSVTGQTLKDIEIICVDDGSTDRSPLILDEYAEKDKRITVIHKKNGGLVSARKAGVCAASGNYVGYVDSDDWIEPDMYETLYEKADRYQVDLVTSGYFFEGNYVTEHYDTLPDGWYEKKRMAYLRERTIYNLSARETGLRATLCSKLFRADLIKKIQLQIPDAVSISEDKVCLVTYMLECESAYLLKKAYYHYIIHGKSMVHKGDTGYLAAVNSVYQYFLALFGRPEFTSGMRRQAEIYITEMLIHGINTRLGFENRNMLWVDPYWLDRIPHGAKILLYGAGELGGKYRKQLGSRADLQYAGCMDYGYEKHSESEPEVKPPADFLQAEYDYIVITIKNKRKAEEVRKQLIQDGMASDKVLWFEQKEIYWKFLEAEGLLE